MADPISTAAAPAAGAGAQDGLPVRQRRVATLAIMVTLVLVVLDGAIANVALPTIATALKATPAATIWVVGAYQLALVMALLPCAALGESLGMRRIFTAGIVLFVVASLLCALSPTLGWLVTARFLQGLGAAAVVALGIGLIRFTYPHRLLGSVIGMNAMVVALSGAVGPSLGSAILVASSWPWLFAINLPLGAAVLLAGRALPRPPGTGRPLDLLSAALNAIAFACLFLGVGRLADAPWLGGVLLAASAASLVALVHRERPRVAPLISIDLLRSRPFRISVIASICCYSGLMAGYIALPFYLQHGLQQDAFHTGLYMMPWPLVVAFAGPISGRLADRMSNAALCAAGGLFLATGLSLAAFWPLHGDHLLPLVLCLMLCGLGFGIFQTPNNRNMILSAPRERSGATGGMQGTARLLGETTGSVIMTLLFSLTSASIAPRAGLAVGAVLALAAGVVSTLRIRTAATPRVPAAHA